MDPKDDESLLKFPCPYTIKVMGAASDTFKNAVHDIITKHLPQLPSEAFHMRPSKNGNYLSINIVFEAQSRQQLDAIYQDLSACEAVMMAL